MAISLARTAGWRVGRMRIDVPSRTRSVTAATCDSVISESSQLDAVEPMGGDDVVGDPQGVETELLGARANRRTSAGWLRSLPGMMNDGKKTPNFTPAKGSEQADLGQDAGQEGTLRVVEPSSGRRTWAASSTPRMRRHSLSLTR